MAYCTRADIFAHAIPRGALHNPASLVTVDTSADWLECDGHGFETDDELTFRADAGGSLPSPIVEGTTYYAIRVDDATFQVAASAGGTAIDLTTAGSNVLVHSEPPFDSAIAWAERVIDDMLPAHVVPLETPYPEIVTITAAELAGGKLLARYGSASRTLTEIVDAAHKRIERWGKGVPIRGTNSPDRAGLAMSAASTTTGRAHDWRTYGGL